MSHSENDNGDNAAAATARRMRARFGSPFSHLTEPRPSIREQLAALSLAPAERDPIEVARTERDTRGPKASPDG